MANTCPTCHSGNPETSRFCAGCGTQLTRASQPPQLLTRTLESPVHALTKGSLVAGKYRIIDEIGRGGMGVVYNAEDTTLARRVAIKVLPEAFTGDPERLARFEREAKLLAALNHPNIATIHGLEETGGKRFLVMELVEGVTLAERIRHGPLHLEEILEVCLQIAEGVEAAHEKGIIHRDLKPANIKLAPGGKVKVLDFGLAKALHDEPAASDLSKTPTITGQMTEPGVILGTAAYMSPEQAKGRLADKRTDIWAYGCILFECLAGDRAFQGATVTETIAAILRGEPRWDSLPADTPANIRAVLRRCLQKDPRERLRDIGDARIEMKEEAGLPAAPVPALTPRQIRPGVFAAACVAVLLLGVLIGPAARRLVKPAAPPGSGPLLRTSVSLEPGLRLYGNEDPSNSVRPIRTGMAVSADGRFLVYSAINDSPSPRERARLYLRRFDRLNAEPIAGTEGGISPFLSPDGIWVGFWADGKLMKVPLEGGIPAVLCAVTHAFGFSWGAGGWIVFAHDRDSGLSWVSSEGGEPKTLTVPDRSRQEYAHRLPHFLPDGKSLLFTIKRHAWDPEPRVAVLELPSREWRVLIENGADARYVATGHLAFLRKGTLMAVPFDPNRLEVIGQPVPAVADIAQTLNTTASFYDTAAGQFDISPSGSLIYATGGIFPAAEDTLVWVDHKGQVEPVVSFKAPFFSTRLSPDGRRIAYSLFGMESQIWIYDLVRGTATRLTSESMAEFAIWTPDGGEVIFDWLKTGDPNLYIQSIDSGSSIERLSESRYFQWPSSISPDGETLAFVEEHEEMNRDIHFLNIRDRRVTPFLNSRFLEAYPEISPDGRWIAYVTDETGRMEVYVQALAGPRGRWQISHEGGAMPLWAPNGGQLFYRSGDRARKERAWVVDIRTEPGFSAGKPRLLFEMTGFGGGIPIRTWDISRDGRRFLMVKKAEGRLQPITELILVQNWHEELKHLVPTRKN